MKLVLHIGTEKTGTTLLQSWLYANQDRLVKQGVFLSERIGKPYNRELATYFRSAYDDHWNLHNLKTIAEKEAHYANFLESLRAEISEAALHCHTMVITSEHFHSRLTEPDDLARFADFCRETFSEISIVCYLRPQWDVRKSLYSTGVKTNTSTPFSEFSRDLTEDSPYFNYEHLYHRWKEAFPEAALDFRLYDRALFVDGDIRKDFLSAVSATLDAEALDFSLDSANESVQLLMAHAMMAINRALPLFVGGGMDRRNYTYKGMVTRVDALDKGTLYDDQAQHIHDTFQESNARLAREVFGRDQLFDPPREAAQEDISLPISEVAQIVEDVVFALVCDTAARTLTNPEVNLIRDTALKFESGEKVSKEDAIGLMQIASRTRPDGPLIKDRLKKWTQS